jgi:CHAT domain-containing protein/Tfp pilus assembly protein PilF
MPSAPFRTLAAALMLVLSWLSPVPGPPVLAPGEAVEQELAGGGSQIFRLEAETGQHLLIAVEQRGIDVVLACQDPSGRPLGTMDAAEKRAGHETWLISAGVKGSYRVEVRSRLAEVPPGRYRIEVRELPAGAPELEAERLMTEAGLLSFQKEEEPRRKALARYEAALERWRSLGRKADEAPTLLRLAVVHQTLGEEQSMLDRLKEALPLFVSLRDDLGEADTLNYMGVAQIELSQFQDAVASFERSLAIWRAHGDLYSEAVTSFNVCLVWLWRGEPREAIPCYERALPLAEQVREPIVIAGTLNALGGAYDKLGEPRKAREYYDRALRAKHALGDREGEAMILGNVGVLLIEQDAMGEALLFLGQALDVIRKAGNPRWEARILSNLGYAYLSLGEPERALGYFNESLPIRRRLGDRRGEVATLGNLGLAQERLGQVAEAVKQHEQALKIAREVEDRAGEALSLNNLAQGYLKAGEPARALEIFGEAAILQRKLGNRGGLALALQRTGEVEARLGQREKALVSLREALDLYRLLEDRSGQAASLASLAAVERELGRLDQALGHAEDSIALVESVRIMVGDPGLRAAFFASRRLAFDLAVGLRMELARRQPGRGHAEAALALSDRARARSLFDLLQEARMEIRQGISPELRERERDLALKLGRNASKLSAVSSQERQVELRRELSELLADADRLEDEIRRSNPSYAVLDQPALDAAGIRGLLDPDTVLLEYTLGEGRSFLWVVTPDRVESFELSGRAEIEAAARRSYEDVRNLDKKDAEAHTTLSRLLFGQVADRLRSRRLVIVADGALQYIPFAALPDPGDPSGTVPLVAGHEIVSLPSAAVLEAQRRVLADRKPPQKAVAVLADPIFNASDTRLSKPKGGTSRSPSSPPRTSEPALRLQRLPATGQEAKAIAKLLPDQVFVALGAKASRDTALSGDLANYRAVHFATHGMINSQTPRLSFLALSMFDEQGQPREGQLSLTDIYNLELQADLVVLSGCDTALGREIRGEGLVGLTQGFLYAGAERVMASLWRVEDRATAELMSRFYDAMLLDKLSPAAALRSAQLAIRRDPRWQDPFFWAPFVLQGDWL